MKNTANSITDDNTKSSSILISRDEMNLAEFPLTVLSTRANPNIKTLEFKDVVINKNGKEINREWVITGTDKFGLPTSSDDEVLLGLLKLTVDGQFKEKKIFFTRYELLKVLRWSTEGKSYVRLQKALDRLTGVRIKATNAFFDNESKAHSTKNFGILDAYEINDGRDSQHKPSFFIWSDEIFQSFQSGFIKKLDLDFFLDLKSSVSKRLYRYLDKNFWYKSTIQMSLFTLAHEKIGISRNYKYASSIKQQMEDAIEELIKSGFLSSVDFVGKGKNTQIVFFSGQGKPRSIAKGQNLELIKKTDLEAPKESKESSQDDKLTKMLNLALVKRGLKPKQTTSLLSDKSDYLLNKIKKIIEYYDFLNKTGSVLISRSPQGFLYRAVEKVENFSLPKSFDVQEPASLKKPDITQDSDIDEKRRYEDYVSKEVTLLKSSVEPDMLRKLEEDVGKSLLKVKGLISEDRFKDTVAHGVEQKLAKLFAVSSFSEWKSNK